MSISQRTLDQIRELVPLVEFFKDRGVRKEGANHVCNCPFHANDGKSRTLTIYGDGRAHCFRCKADVDVFEAVIILDGVEFPEAVERLAKRAGIEIERLGRDSSDQAAQERSRRGAAFAAAEWATGWMHQQLLNHPVAMGYLRVDRRLPEVVIADRRLGWAPGDVLINAARDAGHGMDALRDAGLVVERDGKLRSFYFERITIPITNSNGRVINWSARALPEAMKEASAAGRHMAKYINGSDTLIYQKRRALLGLHAARQHIEKHGAIVVVEGGSDVLALAALDMPVGCCTCGTALSDEQAATLIDMSTANEVPIVLLYNGDGAGSAANLRSAELLFRLGGRARIGLLPATVKDVHGDDHKAKDCGDVWEHAGQAGAKIVAEVITKSQPAWEWLIDRHCPAAGATDLDARQIAADKLLAIVGQIEDDLRREMAIGQAAERLNLTRQQLTRRSDRQREELARKSAPPTDPGAAGNTTQGGWGFKIPAADPSALQPPGKEVDCELNELGNALRFAAHFGARVRYVATWGSWLVWTGTHWASDQRKQVNRWMMEAIDTGCRAEISRAWDKARAAPKNSRDAEQWTSRAQDLEAWRSKNLCARACLNSLELATTLYCLVVTSDQLDADPFLFACKNGWIDLRTGLLSPHDATKLYTRSCPIDYDPSARDVRWDRFLQESSGNDPEIIGFLRRYAGYCATGDTGDQVVVMIAGPGGSGKSLLTRCMQLILGGYAYSADFSIFLTSHGDKKKWTLANLEKARLLVCEESSEGRRYSADMVKLVTGGTPIEAEAKGRQPFTYIPQFKVLFVTNHPPRVSDRDDAFWRRMKLVRFDHVPPKRDKNLAAHLTTTRSAQQAILAWVIAGAQEWHRDGLQPPAKIDQANAVYRDEQNPIRDYLTERTIWADVVHLARPDADVDAVCMAKAQLRLDYLDWCKGNGVEPISSNQLNGRLRELGATEDSSAYNPDKGRYERAWCGLRLRQDALDTGLPGGPAAYLEPTHPLRQQRCLDSGVTESTVGSPTTPASNAPSQPPESSHTCCNDPTVSAQPQDTPGANTTTDSTTHPRAGARDACATPAHDAEGDSASSIRARMSPDCNLFQEREGVPTGEEPISDADPAPGSRADKLRRPPGPGEDLFADSPPEGPLREPGADEGEVWPPPEEPPTDPTT